MSMTDEEIRLAVGGVAFPMVSKFNRGDLYSTTEKIVGQWLDGKPLYQKTYIFLKSQISSGEFNVSHDIDNVDKIWFDVSNTYLTSGTDSVMWAMSAWNAMTPTEYCFLGVWCKSEKTNGIGMYVGSGLYGVMTDSDSVYLTVRYTKTTDSAIKVGTGTDYSTDEQIIGSWIDGKPLYQKTFETTTPANNTDTLIVELPSNCIARSFDGYILQSGYNHIPLNAYYSSAEFVCTYMQFNPDNGIRMKCENTQWRSSTAVITVLYTKTTD